MFYPWKTSRTYSTRIRRKSYVWRIFKDWNRLGRLKKEKTHKTYFIHGWMDFGSYFYDGGQFYHGPRYLKFWDFWVGRSILLWPAIFELCNCNMTGWSRLRRLKVLGFLGWNVAKKVLSVLFAKKSWRSVLIILKN